MRVVQQPISYNEFNEKYRPIIKADITNIIKKPEIEKNRKKATIFLGLTLGFLVLFIIFTIILVFTFSSAPGYDDSAKLLVLMSLMMLVLLLCVLFGVLWGKFRNKLFKLLKYEIGQLDYFRVLFKKMGLKFAPTSLAERRIYDEDLDLQNAYKEHFDTIRQPIRNYEKYLVNYAGIPAEATIVSRGQQYFIADEWNNNWMMQMLTFHWVYTIYDHTNKTTRKVDCYKTVFAMEGVYAKVPNDNYFTFSMGTRCALNGNQKPNVNLENVAFNKAFHIYTNDQVKIRQAFTPLAMETALNHVNQNIKVIPAGFGLQYSDHIVRSWFIPKGDPLKIDLPAVRLSMNKVIEFVVNDIINGIYSIYWVISLFNIPPMFY
ncbi:DUF3137 domain-containing protein [Mycoplasmopsis columbinasalis]|uniref:Protein of uncharacterized function (DUF3137) n=1 Tax=Mycoplasmopsis columbinasalis TaxID=114880 RepID=A0A449BA27_9BACT|nr:DUF3137 domain-containing protein [Mycoplasmopsis columbinasalis]VEU78052.1 Protein of uncharacterised function (DUF3137) [Mycoplasmopsis columbinasalis]